MLISPTALSNPRRQVSPTAQVENNGRYAIYPNPSEYYGSGFGHKPYPGIPVVSPASVVVDDISYAAPRPPFMTTSQNRLAIPALSMKSVSGAFYPASRMGTYDSRQKPRPVKVARNSKHKMVAPPMMQRPVTPGFVQAPYCAPTGQMNPAYIHSTGAMQSYASRQMHRLKESALDSVNKGSTKSEKSRRVSKRCKIENCVNSVVQGGLCIAHGAKRKQCKHPGCNKNVKSAGLCSAHGPARKKCEFGGCAKIAVQGGLCIAHGAKKKLCCRESCTKKGRKAWNHMCKRHFDQSLHEENPTIPKEEKVCTPV